MIGQPIVVEAKPVLQSRIVARAIKSFGIAVWVPFFARLNYVICSAINLVQLVINGFESLKLIVHLNLFNKVCIIHCPIPNLTQLFKIKPNLLI